MAIPDASSAPPTSCPIAPYGIKFNAPGTGKRVALTFDDGPGRDTRAILGVLGANQVIATFFNVGVNEASDPGQCGRPAPAGTLSAGTPGTTRA